MARDLFAELRAAPAAPQASPDVVAPTPVSETSRTPRNLFDPSIFPDIKPVGSVEESDAAQAPYGTRALAQFADDPNAQMRLYAEGLQAEHFPDKTVDEIVRNNMKIVDGDIAITFGEPTDDRRAAFKYYRVEPSGTLSQIAQALPAMAPEAVMSSVLAGAGSLAGAASPVPGGSFLGGAGGAALGAAGGEGYRKAVGGLILGEQQDTGQNIKDMGTAAAWAAGGEAFFGALGRLMRGKTAKGAENVDFSKAENIEQLASQHGITLTPAQSSGLQSLMARQKVLMNSPDGQDIMREFFDVQNGQIQDAVYNFFSTMSPVEAPREGFQKGISALMKRKQQLVNRRKAVASRDYAKAFEAQTQPVDTSKMIESLSSRLENANSGQQRAISSIIKELTGPDGNPKTSLEALHNAKVQIDDYIKNANRGSGSAANMNIRELESARQQLLSILDSQSPDYAKARKRFEILSKPINSLDESVAGDIMQFDPREAYKVGKTLFSEASGPAEVRKTMQLMRNMNPEAADAVTRGYLQSVFEKALKETQQGVVENIGGKARKAMFGTVLDRRMLRAAMTPEQYRGFSDLMEVLQATTRGTSRGSDTAFNQAQQQIMKEEAKGKLAKTADLVTLSKQRIMDSIEQIRLGKYTEEMARLFTSGKTLKEYRRAANVLKANNPSSEAYWDALGAVAGGITGEYFGREE